MSGAQTRRLAALCIHDTLARRQTLDRTFETTKGLTALSPSDLGFVRALVQAAFRELGRIDNLLAEMVSRPFGDLDPMVQALLRVGAVQLWRLDTPPHAGVGETVAAARLDHNTSKASGLINAVLRRAAERDAPLDTLPAQAIWPVWFRDRLSVSLSEHQVNQLAQAQLKTPMLHLTAKAPAKTAKALDGDLLPSGSVSLPMGAVAKLPGYSDGEWWVQDAAATLPVSILAPIANERVLDLCAAPGGKTMQLAQAGADVTALDRSEGRLKRVVSNLDRTQLGDRATCVTADGRTYKPDEPYDAVLLDAPCSAMGTLARQPEGAWIKRPEDLEGFPRVQQDLLAAAHNLVKPGGRMVYCVCTPLVEEGRVVIEDALKGEEWERDPIVSKQMRGFEHCGTPEGDLLTIPSNDEQHDAFFISRLIRRPV